MTEDQYQEWKAKEITGWDAEFIAVELQTLFEMILVSCQSGRSRERESE